MSGCEATGNGPAHATPGSRGIGFRGHVLLPFGWKVTGCDEAAVGFGCPVTGAKPRLVCKSDLHRAALKAYLRRDA
jgi:hypothetical protein